MKEEVWKPLIYKDLDLTDRIAVSSHGRIKNIQTGRILKQTKHKSGYPCVCISLGGRTKKMMIRVHEAVALMFVDGYSPGLVVDHVDGIKANNYYENLEWVTHQENSIRAFQNGLTTPYRKKVRCTNTGQIFDTIKSASIWSGLHQCSSAIGEQIKGRIKHAGHHPETGEPLTWEFVNQA